MNTANPALLLRSLIVYAVIVPLAIIVGYMLSNPLDYGTMGFIAVLAGIMIFPLLIKWHYPLLDLQCCFSRHAVFFAQPPQFLYLHGGLQSDHFRGGTNLGPEPAVPARRLHPLVVVFPPGSRLRYGKINRWIRA